MTTKTTEELIARIKTDPEFRKQLHASPAATLAADGFAVDDAIVSAIEGVSAADFEAMARDFENMGAAQTAAM